MRKIVLYPNKILRVVTPEIIKVTSGLKKEINDLSLILKKGDNAAGLAAPQIGLNKRFFGTKEIGDGGIRIFINPKIEKTFGEMVFPMLVENDIEDDFWEGCLSFPDFFGTVKRFLKIKVSWQEIKNDVLVEKEDIFEGFEAIVFQHELDHLNGIVFTDHVKEDKGKFCKMIGKEMVKADLSKFN
jgi:peptide deformylase